MAQSQPVKPKLQDAAQKVETGGPLSNASQGQLNNESDYNWVGAVGQAPSCPPSIKDGRHGMFLHRGDTSVGAVVYRGGDSDWLTAWSTTGPAQENNKVRTV